MQQALVTGGSGFIGSALIAALAQRGVKVRALLRPTSSLAFLEGVPFEAVQGDLRDEASLERAVAGVDYVFHLAGAVTASSLDAFRQHNAAGTARLGNAVRKVNPGLKRFVYVSSVSAAGPSPTQDALTEDHEPRPISDYGLSKLEGERELAAVLGDTPLTILRPPPVYGPRDKGIFQFIKILNRGIVPVIGSLERYYSFIYVSDLVDLIVAAALTPGQGHREIYYAVGDEAYSWSRIMEAGLEALGRKRVLRVPIPTTLLSVAALASHGIAKLTGRSFELTLDKNRELQQAYYVYSNGRARQRLGFTEQVKIEDGMKRAVIWYREQGWL